MTNTHSPIELELAAQPRHIDSLDVGRVLPSAKKRSVGPFVFLDQMGPGSLPAGQGLDVRPHPHIHLSTVTYLFDGEIRHRDSLGFDQVIRPGAINWMTAGRGIVHSERSPQGERDRGPKLHGLQFWIAMPKAHEDADPAFHHHAATALPELDDRGVSLRVLVGEAFGERSPVKTFSPMIYLEVLLESGATFEVPREQEERAIYLVSGELELAGQTLTPQTMYVLAQGDAATVRATRGSRFVIIGGAKLDGPRYIWWNFVSSEKARIEQAAEDWKAGRFPKVPGDEVEFIPLTDTPRFPHAQDG